MQYAARTRRKIALIRIDPRLLLLKFRSVLNHAHHAKVCVRSRGLFRCGKSVFLPSSFSLTVRLGSFDHQRRRPSSVCSHASQATRGAVVTHKLVQDASAKQEPAFLIQARGF
jgi:hypothetical protein